MGLYLFGFILLDDSYSLPCPRQFSVSSNESKETFESLKSSQTFGDDDEQRDDTISSRIQLLLNSDNNSVV